MDQSSKTFNHWLQYHSTSPFSSFIPAGVMRDIWFSSKASQDEYVRSDPGPLYSLMRNKYNNIYRYYSKNYFHNASLNGKNFQTNVWLLSSFVSSHLFTVYYSIIQVIVLQNNNNMIRQSKRSLYSFFNQKNTSKQN